MKTYGFALLVLIGVAALQACGKSTSDGSARLPEDSASTAMAGSIEGPQQMGRMMDSASMPGMGAMMGGRMMDSMQTHMRTMAGMSPDQMKAMVPMHRQMVASMLSSFDDSMQKMNMPADPVWIALRDSVRQDVTHMPDLSAVQLRTLIPQHHDRLTRFMKMHRDMMAK